MPKFRFRLVRERRIYEEAFVEIEGEDDEQAWEDAVDEAWSEPREWDLLSEGTEDITVRQVDLEEEEAADEESVH